MRLMRRVEVTSDGNRSAGLRFWTLHITAGGIQELLFHPALV